MSSATNCQPCGAPKNVGDKCDYCKTPYDSKVKKMAGVWFPRLPHGVVNTKEFPIRERFSIENLLIDAKEIGYPELWLG